MPELLGIELPRTPELEALVERIDAVCTDENSMVVMRALMVLFLAGLSKHLPPPMMASVNSAPLAHIVLALFEMVEPPCEEPAAVTH